MLFTVRIAGINITVQTIFKTTYEMCKDYLVSEEDDTCPGFSLAIDDDMLQREKHVMKQELDADHIRHVKYYNSRYIEKQLVYRLIAENMPFFDIFLMHGSVVSTNGSGYMFIAPSGVGKTTRANIWLKEYPGSYIVNGDKPLIKIMNEGIFACGTPWCGKEGMNTNTMVPLRTVFLVRRVSEGETNTISELTMGEAFPNLLQHTYRPKDSEAMKKTINLLKALDGKVKLYCWRSAPTPDAIHMAYEATQR